MVFRNRRLYSRPFDLAIMPAVVGIVTTSDNELCFLLFVLQGEDGSVEIIVEPEPAHQVGALDGIRSIEIIRQTIIGQFPVGFVLFIISFSPGQEGCNATRKDFAELMVVEKLVMCLDVIVGFIVVRIAGFLRACGVIGPVGMQDVFRNAVPGLVGFFVARENIQP